MRCMFSAPRKVEMIANGCSIFKKPDLARNANLLLKFFSPDDRYAPVRQQCRKNQKLWRRSRRQARHIFLDVKRKFR